MVYTESLNKKVIAIEDGVFDAHSAYKIVKSALVKLDYVFFEKEQSVKDDKYGRQILLKFEGHKDIDEFARAAIKLEVKFKNLHKITIKNKEIDSGDVTVLIIPSVDVDYKNKWAKSKFDETIFLLYKKYLKKSELKKKYYIPISKEVLEVYGQIKESLELYK